MSFAGYGDAGSEDFKHRISAGLINAEANKEEAAIAVIKEMPEFTRLHTTNGKWDLAPRYRQI